MYQGNLECEGTSPTNRYEALFQEWNQQKARTLAAKGGKGGINAVLSVKDAYTL